MTELHISQGVKLRKVSEGITTDYLDEIQYRNGIVDIETIDRRKMSVSA